MMAPVASVSLAGILAGIEWVRPPALGHVFFFFNDTAAAEVFALSLLDALPISLGRLAVSLMLPEPAAVQVPPPAPTQVQVQGREAGWAPATLEPAASFGPSLETGRG